MLKLLVLANDWVLTIVTELASLHGLTIEACKSFSELVGALAGTKDGDPFVAAVVDSNTTESSLETMCRRVLPKYPTLVLIVLDHVKGDRQHSDDHYKLPESVENRYVGRIKICPAIEGPNRRSERLQSVLATLGENASSGMSGPRQRARDERNEEDTFQPPNSLAQEIEGHLKDVSASIHLSPETLDANFVEMAFEAPKGGVQISDEALKLWQAYRRTHPINAGPTRDFELDVQQNALVRFDDLLRIKNRFTYFVLGERGCGKTTFLAYYFNRYANERADVTFVVNFLTYDYVRDAQTLASELVKKIILSPGVDLPEPFAQCASYEALLDNAEINIYDLLRCPPVNADLTMCRDFLMGVLFSMGDDELEKLREVVDAGNKLPVRSWRDGVIARMKSTEVGPIVFELASWSRLRREVIIANQIIKSAVSAGQYSSELTACGIDSMTGVIKTNRSLEESAHALLMELLKSHKVNVVVDNADRATFADVELEIFRTSWEYLPTDGPLRVNLIFAMRKETFFRHQSTLPKYGIDLNLDVHDVANVASLVLKAPSFVDVARVRVSNLAKTLETASPKASETLRQYVLAVLDQEVAGRVFASIFEGDLRRSLEVFEQAMASPFMEGSLIYYSAQRAVKSGEKPTLKRDDPLRHHRLITSLMFGQWTTFDQRRQPVFLNVYSVDLPARKIGWNTILPGYVLLAVVNAGAIFEEDGLYCDVRKAFGCSREYFDSIVALLSRYRLIHAGRGENAHSESELRPTSFGRYYVQTLMFSLEFVQTVYWDIPLPRSFRFPRFANRMDLADLELFTANFARFIRNEEVEVLSWNATFAQQFLRKHLRGDTLAERIRSQCGAQVSRIYGSMH